MYTNEPFVSILTPVYNGEKYLAECIESVLAQTYQYWEYLIVNNCSTDGTLAIAQMYAKKDPRIQVYSNEHFVGVIENHNITFRLISPESKYCKVISADDWMYPECIMKLVELAERNPTVGIVLSYSINANGMRWPRLPIDTSVFNGRDICRSFLLGSMIFSGPSSLLFRSSFVRAKDSFFPGSRANADTASCLDCLKLSDLGLVHQILSFERVHDESITAKVRELGSYRADHLELIMKYGPIFLTHDEFKNRVNEVLRIYYSFLANGVVNLRDKVYWNCHEARLRELGYPLFGVGLAKAVCMKILDLSLNPKQTFEKLLRRLALGCS